MEPGIVTERIMIQAHSEFRGLQLALAERFAEEHASKIMLYCANKQEKTYWVRKAGEIADVRVNASLYETARLPVGDEKFIMERARGYETEFGVTINGLSVMDRHLGRGYALGGFKHPRSQISESTSYAQMVAAFVNELDFWTQEFDAFMPTLVIGYNKIQAIIARGRGIPFRLLTGARYKNYYQWFQNEFFENTLLEERYRETREPAMDGAETIAAPYKAHMDTRTHFHRTVRLDYLLKESLFIVLRYIYWNIRRYEKGRGYLLSDRLAYPWRRRVDTKLLSGKISKPLSALEGRRFVYYPLHTEPEVALQGLSPEYFYQLSCIAALSRDLPAGTLLAVKETFQATGRRPTDFYRQIAEFKNVVMLDMLELGPDVIEACDAVATITGTAGLEGAVMGKPVITFGQHNMYNFLEHVSIVTAESQLRGFLEAALSEQFDKNKALSDGQRFLQALVSCSFDLQDYNILEPEKVTEEQGDEAYHALICSLKV
tara:strand:- start:708 stop:2174 length:1467 start_codon:yes stop_codon:yes gene_type:complete